jgi:transcriptional regulator with XRE-family HTH domain
MNMCERIRNLREDRDLTQSAIAELLHCTQVCYSNYENGKRDIPIAVLEILADFYGVSVDYLLGRTNVKKPYPRK